MALLGSFFILLGLITVGLGQRSRGPIGPELLGSGVVLVFGGLALVSFRSGDRLPWLILGVIGVVLSGLAVSAFSRRGA